MLRLVVRTFVLSRGAALECGQPASDILAVDGDEGVPNVVHVDLERLVRAFEIEPAAIPREFLIVV